MFYGGQKVVCVDASPAANGEETRLVENATYTVLRSFTSWTKPALTLVEVDPGPRWTGYRAARFRPAVMPRKTASAVARIIRSAKEPAPA